VTVIARHLFTLNSHKFPINHSINLPKYALIIHHHSCEPCSQKAHHIASHALYLAPTNNKE